MGLAEDSVLRHALSVRSRHQHGGPRLNALGLPIFIETRLRPGLAAYRMMRWPVAHAATPTSNKSATMSIVLLLQFSIPARLRASSTQADFPTWLCE